VDRPTGEEEPELIINEEVKAFLSSQNARAFMANNTLIIKWENYRLRAELLSPGRKGLLQTRMTSSVFARQL